MCHWFRSSQRWRHFSPLSRLWKMEQFCSIFAVCVQILPPYTLCKWKQIIEKSFWTGHSNLYRFRSSQRWLHFSPLSRLGKMEQFCSILLFESKFDHLIPYVNESKSLRRVFGQDPLICHRFRSSQRWWHFSPLSRLGKMDQFWNQQQNLGQRFGTSKMHLSPPVA